MVVSSLQERRNQNVGDVWVVSILDRRRQASPTTVDTESSLLFTRAFLYSSSTLSLFVTSFLLFHKILFASCPTGRICLSKTFPAHTDLQAPNLTDTPCRTTIPLRAALVCCSCRTVFLSLFIDQSRANMNSPCHLVGW